MTSRTKKTTPLLRASSSAPWNTLIRRVITLRKPSKSSNSFDCGLESHRRRGGIQPRRLHFRTTLTPCQGLSYLGPLVFFVPELWFPQFHFVSFGVHHPSKAPVLVEFGTLQDRHAAIL